MPSASAIERLVSVTWDWMVVAPELTWTPERESWSMTEPTASLTLRTRASVSRSPCPMRFSAPARTASSSPPGSVTVWVRSASLIRRAATRICSSGRVSTTRPSTQSRAANARDPTSIASQQGAPELAEHPCLVAAVDGGEEAGVMGDVQPDGRQHGQERQAGDAEQRVPEPELSEPPQHG